MTNLYAPNDDDPNFFTTVFSRLLNFHCEEIIIGVDFNLVLDPEKDKRGDVVRTHKLSMDVITAFSEDLDRIDAWRVLNPDLK